MTNCYCYHMTFTETDGFTHTGHYYFIDHLEAADFLDENDREGVVVVILDVEEISKEEFLRHC